MVFALPLCAALLAVDPSTTVEAQRPAEIDDDSAFLQDAALSPDPSDALLSVLGASLVHDGGPLAPSRPTVRGLSGARLHADIGGLRLDDPATGIIDAAALPFASADALRVTSGAGEALGGALHLSLFRRPGFRARVLAGSVGTARGQASVSDGNNLVAVDAGLTQGNFTFVPTSAIDAKNGDPLVRDNNDRVRLNLLGGSRLQVGPLSVDALAFGAVHDGGIPGFARSPTNALRGEDRSLGARVAVSLQELGRPTLAVDARGAHRATFGPGNPRQTLESVSLGAALSATSVLLSGVLIDIEGAGRETALVDGRFARTEGSVHSAVRAPLGPWRIRTALDLGITNDVGILVGGEARVEVGDNARASLGISRASRAPTLDEMYAPRGLVLGNSSLRPETAHDLELAFAFIPARIVHARVVGFAGVIDDAIVYVNKNAYEVGPVNLGRTWRAGIDVAASVEPAPFLGLDLVTEALASAVEQTGAALPSAPAFSSKVAVRLGERAGLHASAALRARGETSSNTFGTLKASPYALVDLRASIPIEDNLSLGFAVDNALDVLTARDANQIPLPGRLVFLSIEVRG